MTRDPVPGLEYDEPIPRRRADRRRADRRRAKRRRRVLPKLLLTLVLIAALVGAGLWGVGKVLGKVGGTPESTDYPGPGIGSVVVHILPGSSARGFGEALQKQGVVKSTNAFVDAVSADGRAESLQPGWYRMRRQMSAAGAVTLLFDPKSNAGAHVSVPEGLATSQLLTMLAQRTGRPLSEYRRAILEPTALGLPPEARGQVEGFLFPFTYDFSPGENALQQLQEMVRKYKAEAAELHLASAAGSKGLTVLKALTVASIIEKEVRNPDERAKVARVIYNRLNDKGDFPTLGMDSTTRYASGNYTGRLTAAQIDSTSAYNTRREPGLPPGPISNPGAAAISAALDPTPGPWLYFVTLHDGVTRFVTTKADFTTLSRQLAAEGG